MLGEHATLESCAGATTFRVAVRFTPPAAAVSVAVWSDVTAATAAVKVAVVAPAETVTDPGTLTLPLLLVIVTARPPVPAAALKVMVQAELPGAFTLAGEQDNPESCPGATSESVAVRVTPPAAAVMVADWLVATVETVAVKFAVVAPAGTVTEDGTVTLELLSDVVTAKPPVGAAPLKVTVQAELPGLFTVEGEQLNPDSVTAGAGGAIEMEAPVPVRVSGVPAAVVAVNALNVTGMVEVAAAGEIVKVTVASCPLGITVALIPNTRQVVDPTASAHEMLLPLPVADEPALTATALTCEPKFIVHCRPVGCAPPVTEIDNGSVTVDPGAAEPELSEIATCASACGVIRIAAKPIQAGNTAAPSRRPDR